MPTIEVLSEGSGTILYEFSGDIKFEELEQVMKDIADKIGTGAESKNIIFNLSEVTEFPTLVVNFQKALNHLAVEGNVSRFAFIIPPNSIAKLSQSSIYIACQSRSPSLRNRFFNALEPAKRYASSGIAQAPNIGDDES